MNERMSDQFLASLIELFNKKKLLQQQDLAAFYRECLNIDCGITMDLNAIPSR